MKGNVSVGLGVFGCLGERNTDPDCISFFLFCN